MFCTESFEWGVYRVTDLDRKFLLFSFDNREEALERSAALAKLLGVPFKHSGIPTEKESPAERDIQTEACVVGGVEIEYPEKPRPKLKRVTGISDKIKQMLNDGKSDEDILTDLVQLYLAAGRSECYGRQMIKWYLQEERKKRTVGSEQHN
jgi:hypothetical protein